MVKYNVPRSEFYELVRNVDVTLFEGLNRIKPEEVDKSIIKKFEERVGQYFDEFSNKFPSENVTNARNVATDGIPAYISAFQNEEKHERNSKKIAIIGSSSFLAGLLSLAAIPEYGRIFAYLGMPLFVSGIAMIGWLILREERRPLTVYRKQYRNQIINAYIKQI
jgi:hypothetical protein